MTALIDTTDLSLFIGSDATGDAGDFACSAASQVIVDYLDNVLIYEADVVARLDGSGTDALLLPQPPVRYVTSVVENEITLTVDDDYFLGKAGILFRTTWRWPAGRGNVVVTYDRGFDLVSGPYGGPYDAPEMLLPDSVKLVALALAKRILASGALPVGGFSSETMGRYSYTLDVNAAEGIFDLTVGEASALSRYRDARVT